MTSRIRSSLHEIIFEADTRGGKIFDIALMVVIVASVIAVVLESVEEARIAYGSYLRIAEWAFTVLFSIEYALRLYSVRKPLRYAFSFFGLIDLLAVAPTYLSFFFSGAQSLIVIRALRLMRVFRVLKLTRFVGEASMLYASLRASVRKIVIFLAAVLTLAVIVGAAMYLIEGEKHGFTSIPQSVYWAIVTLTTVGYGDIAPQTVPGKMLASLVMIMGYGIIAVPTGIVTVEMAHHRRSQISTQACPSCSHEGHDADATLCKYCGAQMAWKE